VIKVTKDDVEKAKKNGQYSINERVEEAGFVYFEGGRVTWTIKNTADPDDFEIELFESWGAPSQIQVRDIMRLVAKYVAFNRQEKVKA
jgi:hypothetical protein